MLRVEIEWVDSGAMVAGEQWTSTDDIIAKGHVGPVTSVGQLLLFTDEIAMVGLSHDEENSAWFGVQVIDVRSINRISVLRSRKDYTPQMFDTLRQRVV